MAQTTWIFLGVGWLLVLLGMFWIAWALFRDRARGRRRCPKCWYAMEGAPGPVCPECGHEARNQAKLFRTRRRWRQAMQACVVMALGIAALQVPRYQRGGWYGLIPGSLLVLIAPADFPPQQAATAGRAQIATATNVPTPPTFGIIAGNVVAAPPVAPAPPTTRSDELRGEVWKRMTAGKLWRWQSQLFFNRYFQAVNVHHDLTLPKRWVVGEPLVVITGTPLPQVFSHLRLATDPLKERAVLTPRYPQVRIGPPVQAGSAVELLYELSAQDKNVYSLRMMREIDVRPDLASLLDRAQGVEADALVLRTLSPRLVREGDRLDVRFEDRALDMGIEYAVAFTVTVIDQGQIIGEGRGKLEWKRRVWKDWENANVKWNIHPEALARSRRTVQVVIRADPVAAACMYLEEPFRLDPECWDGEVRVEVEVPGE